MKYLDRGTERKRPMCKELLSKEKLGYSHKTPSVPISAVIPVRNHLPL